MLSEGFCLSILGRPCRNRLKKYQEKHSESKSASPERRSSTLSADQNQILKDNLDKEELTKEGTANKTHHSGVPDHLVKNLFTSKSEDSIRSQMNTTYDQNKTEFEGPSHNITSRTPASKDPTYRPCE